MQNRGKYSIIFFILLLISLLLFGLSRIGILKFNFISGILSPVQKEIHNSFIQLSRLGINSETELLREENRALTKKIVDQQKLMAQNKALLDQFQQVNPKSSSLLQADVIGSPGFVPGISIPEFLIINRGFSDGVKEGNAVVLKNNLVGKIIKTLQGTSLVYPIGNNLLSFAAKVDADKKAVGIIKGQGGGEMILDNVLLSETLKVGEVILTNGDIDQEEKGFPPDLIVGKIISVDKNPSALFQKADIVSFIDLSKLSTVFVQIQK
ncbi:MAG: hypothetical protein CO135_00835 [Candidatus Levybacteria bacterium CG_4_9_14_3_um_filter_35_16]|nr:MAG: hypothetical protein COW87_00575 [Candidatus Levybacteria bacterium CG22_combo_CG10-13_8_21_14_all_35_11]PIY94283.1 MAG: hypothetical protein COY68_03400 [Candidatus Levybacteria bacterium CG_4_10_14_0_8_um_filter_35_23]PJA91503.1 MAG: hypothetical protein CO135_00835 [Candidatus Levybacteria bacterium CG_4_9_14_3_um_filter_35_16]PJC54134.1 MAG: hypothetical protein CO028_04005 [Candidatus Levybacteria bacterium CG_4_9_14_0_2_um_filter_35_21]